MTRRPRNQKRIALIGAGGHGRVVADIAEALGYDEITFYDQNWPQQKTNLHWPVAGRDLPHVLAAGTVVFVSIGQGPVRLALLRQMMALGITVPTLVHPASVVSPHARIGSGTVVMAGAVINAGAHLGQGCIVNTSASVDHDCVIADGVHISPGAHLAGGVKVGEASWIGIGSAVIELRNIGSRAMVAAGSVVTTDVADDTTVYGVPARRKDEPC